MIISHWTQDLKSTNKLVINQLKTKILWQHTQLQYTQLMNYQLH